MASSTSSSNETYPKLLSLAVHELRTPASVVGGYLRMLQRDNDPALSERQRRMVDEAERSCQRLVAIVGEMSDLAKLDAGLVSMADQPLDLFSIVEEVAAGMHEAEDRDVRLVVRGPATGAAMKGDAARLGRAFDAIFRAILREKAGPATIVAERRLETIDGRRSAVVVVADEASVQAAYSSAACEFDEKRGGLGLALPLARRVIDKHGGRVWSPTIDPAPGETLAADTLARGAAVVAVPLTNVS